MCGVYGYLGWICVGLLRGSCNWQHTTFLSIAVCVNSFIPQSGMR